MNQIQHLFAGTRAAKLLACATGSTFIEYLNYVRISHAERLLYRTDRSVLDVAMDVGFSSVSYFNRIFKRFRNCTPNDFRKASYLRE